MGSGPVKQIGSLHDGLSKGRVRMYGKAHIGYIGAHFNSQNALGNEFTRARPTIPTPRTRSLWGSRIAWSARPDGPG